MFYQPATMGSADVALTEIVEGKLDWEIDDPEAPVAKPKPKRKKRSSSS